MPSCPNCGWWDRFCHCSPGEVAVIDHAWVTKGAWEHIDPANPNMKIDSKQQLIRECKKRGLAPRAFMKPKSQGKGYEYV